MLNRKPKNSLFHGRRSANKAVHRFGDHLAAEQSRRPVVEQGMISPVPEVVWVVAQEEEKRMDLEDNDNHIEWTDGPVENVEDHGEVASGVVECEVAYMVDTTLTGVEVEDDSVPYVIFLDTLPWSEDARLEGGERQVMGVGNFRRCLTTRGKGRERMLVRQNNFWNICPSIYYTDVMGRCFCNQYYDILSIQSR